MHPGAEHPTTEPSAAPQSFDQQPLSLIATVGQQLKAEGTFRAQALGFITSMVGPDAPKDLKVFVIVVVGSFLLMSCTLTIFGLHLICAWRKVCSPCVPYVYLVVSLAPFIVMTVFGVPLIRRADEVEHSLRLQSSLMAISSARRRIQAPLPRITP